MNTTTDSLYVGVRVRNPHEKPAPAYWWSNIAVTQRPGVRVLAPASASYRFSYERRLELVSAPVHGYDYSYPAAAPQAADFFFRVDDDRPPWIAALDADGTGLGHASTSRLFGRKPTALRVAAVEALRLAATPAAVGTLQGLAQDSDKQVRVAAQEAVKDVKR